MSTNPTDEFELSKLQRTALLDFITHTDAVFSEQLV
jgi:hypothetical protein